MVAPQPDSLAFHHRPVNGELAEASIVKVCAGAIREKSMTTPERNASTVHLTQALTVLCGEVKFFMFSDAVCGYAGRVRASGYVQRKIWSAEESTLLDHAFRKFISHNTVRRDPCKCFNVK